MNNWIFARARLSSQTLADVVPAAARSIALAGASSHFAAPQLLFISESDGAETEWLGRVTQATTTTLLFSRPLHASKNSGALLWRPASSLEFPPEAIRPERRATATGVAAERTPVGAFYAIQTANPQTELRLVCDDLPATAEDALTLWLAQQTRWGLDPFTLVGPDGKISAVCLSGEPILQQRDPAGRRRLTLTLSVIQEGIYL